MLISKKFIVKSITNVKDLAGKRVLVRCDFSVPVAKGKVIDDYKIVQTLPTIQYLLQREAKIILITHLERPGGKRVKRYELGPIRARLSRLLGKKVAYVHDCVGPKAQAAAAKMKDEQIVLLENVRFYPQEERNDAAFAKKLAGLADLYVNDAFASSHRAHASVSAIQKFLPAYAGLLLEQELTHLQKVLRPAHPFVVIAGGKKIETKVPLIKALRKKADAVLIGGMLAYDFLAAKRLSTGSYGVAPAQKKLAKKMLGKNVMLPFDFVTASKKDGSGILRVSAADALPKNSYQFDIGPQTIRAYARYVKEAKTILWNGPMGMFEAEHFQHGTRAVARLVACRSSGKAFGLVGGGETIEVLRQVKMLEFVDWASTGGGAMLAYLAGEKMPGLKEILK
ncbi:phosphoglycerate kinase [Candidatus Falkowbacteria bacterium RIFOXYC2_FULL_47_12]|uniref:Phosphoglycerate kinase n=2 Tax=Candidatus Falkowiibacteriota TaxID=1752728 RepID=A0A1F5TRP6_9BACT|nr:MAG: phosphoglycerate kinase [Candidatus Falkowbacteria bacterium RIFOXYA2_FULL_47_9]OGF41444.1 MAG: phosphoglycerate kinase [Candidatus Falkowbacteria bacterium RIFOXYC2_FULL_47_12]